MIALIPLTSPNRGYLIPWATSIRVEWLAHCMEGFIKAYPPELADRASDIMIACINQMTDAGWWVDNQDVLREAFGPVWKAEMVKNGLLGE